MQKYFANQYFGNLSDEDRSTFRFWMAGLYSIYGTLIAAIVIVMALGPGLNHAGKATRNNQAKIEMISRR